MALAAASSDQTDNTATVVDVVMIRRADTGEQVFALARPMTANVYEVAKALEHPLEDNSSVVDHIVFLPVEIEMPLLVTGAQAATTYGEIRELFRASVVLTVQTRALTYDNMVLTAMPHDERPEEFDALTVTLQLREIIIAKTTYGGAVIGPAQVAPTPTGQARTSTARRGTQQTQPVATNDNDRGSILFRAFG